MTAGWRKFAVVVYFENQGWQELPVVRSTFCAHVNVPPAWIGRARCSRSLQQPQPALLLGRPQFGPASENSIPRMERRLRMARLLSTVQLLTRLCELHLRLQLRMDRPLLKLQRTTAARRLQTRRQRAALPPIFRR